MLSSYWRALKASPLPPYHLRLAAAGWQAKGSVSIVAAAAENSRPFAPDDS